MAQTKLKTYQFDMPNPSCPGRLTLTTGSPVTTSDVTSASVLYYTPYNGDLISLYDGSYWNNYRFTETSLNLVTSASTTGKNYDIFGYISSGSLALSSDIWSSDTARITNISMQNGIYVKSGSSTHRYLGTIRTSASGRCDDSVAKRFCWNYYNRLPRLLTVLDATATWVYTTATWRSANGSAANRVEVVVGIVENNIKLSAMVHARNSTAGCRSYTGIGLDATNANHATLKPLSMNAGDYNTALTCIYNAYVAVGYHYFQWVEYAEAVGTCTWSGTSGGIIQSGMTGEVMG